MRIAVVLLVHNELECVAELVSTLTRSGIFVAIHADANSGTEFRSRLEQLLSSPQIRFTKQIACSWGNFSIVRATLEGLRTIAGAQWAPDYVILMSGSDYPIKSHESLIGFLKTHNGTEFIESVPISRPWVIAGPQQERVELFFPFNWRTSRRAFERAYRIQMLLRRFIRLRRMPEGISAYIGSQWWALTWKTCREILKLVDARPAINRFFAYTLVPDESYFQSLVRSIVPDSAISGAGLTYYEFQPNGTPVVLYDDHAEHLSRQDYFFARKFSPAATELRATLRSIWFEKGAQTSPVLPPYRKPSPDYRAFLDLDRRLIKDGAPEPRPRQLPD
jgi:hypothetical protein